MVLSMKETNTLPGLSLIGSQEKALWEDDIVLKCRLYYFPGMEKPTDQEIKKQTITIEKITCVLLTDPERRAMPPHGGHRGKCQGQSGSRGRSKGETCAGPLLWVLQEGLGEAG